MGTINSKHTSCFQESDKGNEGRKMRNTSLLKGGFSAETLLHSEVTSVPAKRQNILICREIYFFSNFLEKGFLFSCRLEAHLSPNMHNIHQILFYPANSQPAGDDWLVGNTYGEFPVSVKSAAGCLRWDTYWCCIEISNPAWIVADQADDSIT